MSLFLYLFCLLELINTNAFNKLVNHNIIKFRQPEGTFMDLNKPK